MLKKLRRHLINYLVKHLLVAITEDDIILITGKDYLFKKRKLSNGEVIQLKEEARSFNKSLLWYCIKNEVGWLASRQMFDEMKVADDMVFGKAMLYDIDIIKKYITRMSQL